MYVCQVYTSVCAYIFFTDQDPQVYVCIGNMLTTLHNTYTLDIVLYYIVCMLVYAWNALQYTILI